MVAVAVGGRVGLNVCVLVGDNVKGIAVGVETFDGGFVLLYRWVILNGDNAPLEIVKSSTIPVNPPIQQIGSFR